MCLAGVLFEASTVNSKKNVFYSVNVVWGNILDRSTAKAYRKMAEDTHIMTVPPGRQRKRMVKKIGM